MSKPVEILQEKHLSAFPWLKEVVEPFNIKSFSEKEIDQEIISKRLISESGDFLGDYKKYEVVHVLDSLGKIIGTVGMVKRKKRKFFIFLYDYDPDDTLEKLLERMGLGASQVRYVTYFRGFTHLTIYTVPEGMTINAKIKSLAVADREAVIKKRIDSDYQSF